MLPLTFVWLMAFAYANVSAHSGMDRRGRSTVRFGLGMMQMATSTIAAVLIIRTGVTTWSLIAAVSACLLTTISLLMFGARSPRMLSRRSSARRRG